MKNDQSNGSRPTTVEEQACAEVRQHFAQHLNQFPASRTAIQNFEKDISRTALAIDMTTARTAPSRIRIPTEDGTIWYKSLDLMDKLCACYRPTSAGIEFAVIERLPFASTHEVMARGRNAVDVLKTLAQKQQKALRLWNEDLTAHISEFLAEKYPGQDMHQVANVVMRQLGQSVSHEQAHNQNRSRGIGV